MQNKQKHQPQNKNRGSENRDFAYNDYPDGQDRNSSLQPSFVKPSLDSHLPWRGAQQKIEGLHTGKGPKGYRRSDTRIYEDISEALTHHPGVDASEIEVAVKNAVVTLSGTIESRQMKKMAEECAEEIPGVLDVINELRIDTTYASRSHTSETGARESSSRSARN